MGKFVSLDTQGITICRIDITHCTGALLQLLVAEKRRRRTLISGSKGIDFSDLAQKLFYKTLTLQNTIL